MPNYPCVTLLGNPGDGFTVYGPFSGVEAANEHAGRCRMFKNETWFVLAMIRPDNAAPTVDEAVDHVIESFQLAMAAEGLDGLQIKNIVDTVKDAVANNMGED